MNVLSNPSASLAISVLYEFNDLNQRTKMTREDNSYWSYDYDDLGQVTDAHKKDSLGNMIPSFDFGFKYDDIGNRKSATRVNEGNAQDVIQKYTPNVLNQYSERYVPNTSLIDTVTHRNDGVTQMMVSNTHDKLGRLVNVLSNPSASLAISALYEFNDLNQRTRMTREDNSYWIYDYDDLGQVTDAHKKDSSGGMIPSFDFGIKYDDIGNRRSATRRNAGNDEDVVQKYTSNLLNQYSARSVPNLIDVVGSANADAQVLVNGKQATRSGDLFHKQLVVDNTSDAQWFPLDVIAHDSVAGTYRKESGNQFLPKSPVEPQHDEDGNLTQDGRWSYTWDGENRLIAMETLATAVIAGVPQQKLEFAYDGQSRRIQKKVSGWTGSSWMPDQDTRFIWDGWNLIAELDALDTYTAINTYVWGLDLSGLMQGAGGVRGLLFAESSSGGFIPAYDGNGNVLAYVDASSGVTETEYEYGVFGEVLRTEGETADDFKFQFSTKYVDAETRLYYYGYRFYDAQLGRWLNRDPIEEDGGVNLYGFVGNDGINAWDYLGLFDDGDLFLDVQIRKKNIIWREVINIHIKNNPTGADAYGHWWFEIDGTESYGWWPNQKLADFTSTVFGVPGDLNGQIAFGGTATTDPHHGDPADEAYAATIDHGGFLGVNIRELEYGYAEGTKCDCATSRGIKDCLRKFAKSFSGQWRHPWGTSCHDFLEDAMDACCLDD